MTDFLGLYSYWIVIALMIAGCYVVIASGNLIRKSVGLNIFQTSVFILYITLGKVEDGTAPIVVEGAEAVAYSNPLPHVLILTAIELTQEDLEIVKTIVTPERIEVVWLGEEVTTDVAYDLLLPTGENVEEAVDRIKSMLQERSVIFKPW